MIWRDAQFFFSRRVNSHVLKSCFMRRMGKATALCGKEGQTHLHPRLLQGHTLLPPRVLSIVSNSMTKNLAAEVLHAHGANQMTMSTHSAMMNQQAKNSHLQTGLAGRQLRHLHCQSLLRDGGCSVWVIKMRLALLAFSLDNPSTFLPRTRPLELKAPPNAVLLARLMKIAQYSLSTLKYHQAAIIISRTRVQS